MKTWTSFYGNVVYTMSSVPPGQTRSSLRRAPHPEYQRPIIGCYRWDRRPAMSHKCIFVFRFLKLLKSRSNFDVDDMFSFYFQILGGLKKNPLLGRCLAADLFHFVWILFLVLSLKPSSFSSYITSPVTFLEMISMVQMEQWPVWSDDRICNRGEDSQRRAGSSAALITL